MQTENWKTVTGYEGFYEVSSFGRVRSLQRGGRILKPRSADRYEHVALLGKEKSVHGLVLEAFVGCRPKGMYGLHGDDNTRNNRLSNLRWGTPKENQEQRHSSVKRTRGAIIDKGCVSRVQDLHTAGVSNTQAALYLGINRNLIPKVLENCHRYE